MVRGRKKKNYRSKIRSIHIGDITAWEICKRKGINISEELTRYIQFLAYSHRVNDTAEGLERARLLLLRQMEVTETVEEKEVMEIQKKYQGIRKTLAVKVSGVVQLMEKKKLEKMQEAKAIIKHK